MKVVQLKATDKVSAKAGGRVFEFWITSDIEADEEIYNRKTGGYELKESETAQRHFVDALKDAKPGDEVRLYINSYGGDVKEALGIYNTLRRTGAKITAYIDGFAASAASVIAMAADRVIMPRNTCMMVHNAWWLACGNPAQLRKSADDLEIINGAMLQAYIAKAGDKLTPKKMQAMMDAETWLSAEQCVACGLADEYGERDADMDAAAQQCKQAAAAAPRGIVGLPAALAAALAPQTPAALAAAIAQTPQESGQKAPRGGETQGEGNNPPAAEQPAQTAAEGGQSAEQSTDSETTPAAPDAAPNDGTTPAGHAENAEPAPAEYKPVDGLRKMLAALME